MVLFVVIFVIPMALVAAIAVWATISIRIDLRTLARLACPSCGAVFGAAAAKNAREEHLRRVRELIKTNPGRFLRITTHWPVVCPRCGHRTVYDSQERMLRLDLEPAVEGDS